MQSVCVILCSRAVHIEVKNVNEFSLTWPQQSMSVDIVEGGHVCVDCMGGVMWPGAIITGFQVAIPWV